MSQPIEASETVYTAEWLQRTKVATVPATHAAPILGVGPKAVVRAVRDGSIPAIRFGRKMLIPRQVLLEMLHLPDLSDEAPAPGVPEAVSESRGPAVPEQGPAA
jgi:excisionase family DNA binding protein